MKKGIQMMILGLLLGLSVKSQIVLVDKETASVVPEGTVIDVWGDPSATLMSWHELGVINKTGTTTKINMKRYTLNAQNNTEDYFCWYVCLGAVNSNDNPAVYHSEGACFNSNDSDTLDYFTAYYKPMGLTGNATYRFVWFDADDANDSTYLDITFHVSPLTINDVKTEMSMNVFPNPMDGILNLQLNKVDFNSKVTMEIYDIIGNNWMTQNIFSSNSRTDVSELPNGVYLVKILVDEKTILSRKIIISH